MERGGGVLGWCLLWTRFQRDHGSKVKALSNIQVREKNSMFKIFYRMANSRNTYVAVPENSHIPQKSPLMLSKVHTFQKTELKNIRFRKHVP